MIRKIGGGIHICVDEADVVGSELIKITRRMVHLAVRFR